MSDHPLIGRRALVLAGLAVAPAALMFTSACAADQPIGGDGAASLADPDWALPDEVPAGTKLVIGDPSVQVALQISGLIDELTFDVEWANLSGGPATSEAFRAKALDLGSVADIPGINAHWTNLATKFVAAKYRSDWQENPIYALGVAPGAAGEITTLADLRGRRIAFSPGQAQGALVIRVLAKAGLVREDVDLVEIPSTSDVYLNALASGQVDAAPIGGTAVKRYLAQHDGATTIPHGLRDDPSHLYARAEILQDEATAAAVAAYVRIWARAQRWIEDHPQEWIEHYYVANQRLSAEDGAYLVEAAGQLEIPDQWNDAISRTQETVDLLADFLGHERFDAGLLFDRRFQSVAAESLRDAGGER